MRPKLYIKIFISINNLHVKFKIGSHRSSQQCCSSSVRVGIILVRVGIILVRVGTILVRAGIILLRVGIILVKVGIYTDM